MGEQALCACLLAVAITLGATAGDLKVPADAKTKTLSDYAIDANRAAERGDYAASAAAFETALREAPEETTSKDRLQRAALANGLGVAYARTGRYADAERLYDEAMAVWRELLGPRHPDIAATLNNKAMILSVKGRYEEALRIHQEALSIDEEVFGSNAIAVANDLNNVGVTYAKMRKLSAAETALRRCLNISDTANPAPKRLPEFVSNMASLMGLLHRFEEAEDLHQRVLRLETAARGGTHPSVGMTLLHLADCAIHLKRYGAAVTRASEALTILKSRMGDKHPQTGSAYYVLAVAYEKEKRMDLATPALENAIAIDNQAMVEPATRIAHLREYEALLRAEGRKAEASAAARTADDLERQDMNHLTHESTVDVKELGSFYAQK